MKTPARHLLAATVLFMSTAASLIAANKPAPSFRPLAVELVSTYLAETTDETDGAWAKFAADQKLGDQQLAQTCRQALELARAIVAAGTSADSPHFTRILADSLGVKPPVGGDGSGQASPPANREKPASEEAKPSDTQIAEAKRQLFTHGLEIFRRKSSDVQFFLRNNQGVSAQTWDKEFAELIYSEKTPEFNSQSPVHSFLARLGYASESRDLLQAKKAPTATKSAAVEKLGGDNVRLLPVLSDESFFRDKGIIFSAGGGVVSGNSGGATMVTAAVRWNLRQAKTTARWNRLIGFQSDYYQPITYQGRVLFFPPVDLGTTLQSGRDREKSLKLARTHIADMQPAAHAALQAQGYRDELPDGYDARAFWRSWPMLTCNGPLFGSAVSGEKIDFGGKYERPFLVGWSLGWGFSDHAASLLYFDFAATVSPNSGFRYSRPYVGLSLDGELFGKLFGFARNGKKPSTDPW